MARDAGLLHLFLIDARQPVGVLGEDMDHTGQLVGIHPEFFFFVFGDVTEGLQLLVAVIELGQRLVGPVDLHPLGAGLVAGLGHQRGERRLRRLGVEHHALSLLDVGAHARNQARIFFHQCFCHT